MKPAARFSASTVPLRTASSSSYTLTFTLAIFWSFVTSAEDMVVMGDMRGSFISRTISLMVFLTSSFILSYLIFGILF